MATGNINPTGDVSIAWSYPSTGTHYDDIASDDSLDIRASQGSGDDGDIDRFSFSTTDVEEGEITQLSVYIKGSSVFGGNPEMEIHCGGDLGIKEVVYNGWTTWSGLSKTQTQLDALELSLIADCAGKSYLNIIQYLYIQVTYTPASSGWGHKMIGVAGADIAKVSGVEIADIASIKCVDV